MRNRKDNRLDEGQMIAKQGPDFICIGMQKAATQWLYDQLRGHADLWMPPVKEMHFFDAGFNFRVARNKFRKFVKSKKDWGWKDQSDWGFFQHCFLTDESVFVQQAGIDLLSQKKAANIEENYEPAAFQPTKDAVEWYRGLFDNVGGRLSGDVTPAYSTLQQEQIETIHEAFPDTRIILLVRHPVDRVWSQFRMRVRKGGLTERDLENKDLLVGLLNNDAKVARRSFASESYKRWSTLYREDQIGVFFFDDIAENPREVRERILRFIGAAGDANMGDIQPGFDRKAQQKKQLIPAHIETALAEHFEQEIREIQRLFGGPSNHWDP